ncbi:hypothetical protein BEP19_16740 [Ammoniphilus oxalaticus]|uniref:Uncharacterized protein n=1 Tax=Ammoniphilus oxalaticus TaxID=66863 RepID=A0A419SQ64_9BACL|nr:hypothetical protein [Ammoniphilus oxalaticus]RKD26485.1 hypothetical protein BEP19_16740 [Ammoniphilus oxalaticus]
MVNYYKNEKKRTFEDGSRTLERGLHRFVVYIKPVFLVILLLFLMTVKVPLGGLLLIVFVCIAWRKILYSFGFILQWLFNLTVSIFSASLFFFLLVFAVIYFFT